MFVFIQLFTFLKACCSIGKDVKNLIDIDQQCNLELVYRQALNKLYFCYLILDRFQQMEIMCFEHRENLGDMNYWHDFTTQWV
jgi:hypothetical protein